MWRRGGGESGKNTIQRRKKRKKTKQKSRRRGAASGFGTGRGGALGGGWGVSGATPTGMTSLETLISVAALSGTFQETEAIPKQVFNVTLHLSVARVPENGENSNGGVCEQTRRFVTRCYPSCGFRISSQNTKVRRVTAVVYAFFQFPMSNPI